MFHEPYPKPLKHYHNILLNNQMLTAVFHLPTYIPQNQADTLPRKKGLLPYEESFVKQQPHL